MNNIVPYFNNVYDWVNSLPYEQPLHMYKGKDCGGYVYHSPFKSRWGAKPEYVYSRLFKQEHYYNLTDEELTELRTTIQYMPVYLDTAFNNVIKFLESCGFTLYRKEGKPGNLIHAYLKRNNVSLYVCNQTTPQDYRPNKLEVSVGELVKKPSWKRARRVERGSMFSDEYGIYMPDELGELTRQELEKYIKKYVVELSGEPPVFKERSKLTFGDLYKFAIKGETFKKLTVPVYLVNTKSGTLKTITNAGYVPKESLGHYLEKCICAVFCGHSFSFYATKQETNATKVRQLLFPGVALRSDNEHKSYSDFVLCLEKDEAKKLAIAAIKNKIKAEQAKINELKKL